MSLLKCVLRFYRSSAKSKLIVINRMFLSGVFLILIFCGVNAKTNCPRMQILETGGITCDLIQDILDTHNEMRQIIAAGYVKTQPPASNIRELYWDEELANGAQHWANQCTFAHNTEKDREVARFSVGQNIALTKNKGTAPDIKDFRKQIKNWFNEHTAYKFGPITDQLQISGHYTQLVWADTYLVGCGYSKYKSQNNTVFRLYVCHYGPTGNQIDEKPYNTENQKCPYNLVPSKKYRNLCSSKRPPSNACISEENHRVQDFTAKNENALTLNSRRSFLYNRNFDDYRDHQKPIGKTITIVLLLD